MLLSKFFFSQTHFDSLLDGNSSTEVIPNCVICY